LTAPLPIARAKQVRHAALGEVRADKRAFAAILILNALAAGAGLVGPWLLGTIVNTVNALPGRAVVATVDRLALLIVAFTLAQIVLARYACTSDPASASAPRHASVNGSSTARSRCPPPSSSTPPPATSSRVAPPMSIRSRRR
jgi:hypothetical protein